MPYISPYAALESPFDTPPLSPSPSLSPTLSSLSSSLGPSLSPSLAANGPCPHCDICTFRTDLDAQRTDALRSAPWLVADDAAMDRYCPKGPCVKSCSDRGSYEFLTAKRAREIDDALRWLRDQPAGTPR